jgi:transcriptional regulator with XRE-family HTH domain
MRAPEDPAAEPLSPPERFVARRLSQLRQERGLTLSALSRQTGFSESYLSRVENLKMPVSIGNLARLAEAFGVTVASFFDQDANPGRVQFTPAGAGKVAQLRGRDGVQIRLLASGLKGRCMEPFLVNVLTARTDAPLQAHNGEEFIYVLRGRCRFELNEQTFDLKTGDSIYFDAGIRHRILPLVQRPAEVLSIVTSRDFTFHGNLGRLMND